jgi:small conductance mechanosensitive channel
MDSSSFNLSELTDNILPLITTYGIRLMMGIVVLVIGLWIVGRVSRGFGKVMEKRGLDPSLRSFLKSMLNILLKILLFISVLSMIGLQMTSFIAILGAAGLAVGLALSGTLQNFAGGVLILLFKPFRVGDFIEAQGFMGTVAEISIINTILNTPDNKVIFIPNGGLATGALTNFSKKETRRVDWTFGIAYGDNYKKAKGVILKLIQADNRILSDPEPFIALKELNDSSVDIVVRAWVQSPDYWAVFFDMNEKIYDTFANEGLNIPFPQMDVHLHQAK